MRYPNLERLLLPLVWASLCTAQVVTDFPLRINAGARDPVTDGNGITWEVDQHFTTGYYDSQNRCSSNGPGPHCKIRSFNNARNPAPFGYGVPVPNGEYLVTIHTIETHYKVPNARIMDILVEGLTVFEGLDVFQEAGWRLIPFSFNVTTTVTDGQLDVHVVGVQGNPMLTGIEIDRPLIADEITVSPAPTQSPQPSASPTGTPPPTPEPEFRPILINCGGPQYLDSFGNLWEADFGFSGGRVYSNSGSAIADTTNDPLYQTERYEDFSYALDLDSGNYRVILHFAELYWTSPNKRVFHVDVEGTERDFVDLFVLGGNQRRVAFTLEFATAVSDGELNIVFSKVADWAKLSAIEIVLVGPHLAHSVPNGPYIAVDVNNDGIATVDVDGALSHTHGNDLDLVDFSWMEGPTVLASSATAAFDLPVGDHTISLTVVDNDGNDSTGLTTVSVFPYGYPVVTNLFPESGSIAGGDVLTITGVGFTYSATQTTVHFGDTLYSGSEITIVSDSTITIIVPATTVATPIEVSIETPLGISVSATYGYVNGVPIDFDSGFLADIDTPTVAVFGPDEKLYVGTGKGRVYKLTMNGDFTTITESNYRTVESNPDRYVTGIAFDPMESGVSNPSVYVATNMFLHGDSSTSSGLAINGKVLKLTGADMAGEETIISGLPVSNHDHGINGMIFGDNGDLYMQAGGNTNGGAPGQLSEDQAENYFSAATIVAHLSEPNFDGTITYNSNDEPVGGTDVEVFASGIRNPYGICLHSNGHLYGTDNGPNKGYGAMLTGCGAGESIPDAYNKDKLLLIEQGKYYGHPNPTRAGIDSDPRQCTWRTINEGSDADYQAPLLDMPSSTGGVIEWTTNHFFGQLRGNLITSQYSNKLYRVILEPDGRDVIPQSSPVLALGIGSNGLDVTQAPSGTLIEVRHEKNNLHFHKPKEPSFSELRVDSVFPVRGSQAGGFTLKVYGSNFGTGALVVTVGGQSCPVVASSPSLIECTLPSGVGAVDVTVSKDSEADNFAKGFRYVTGQPGALVQDVPVPSPTEPPTKSPTQAPTDTPTKLPTPAPEVTQSPTQLTATPDPTNSPTKAPTENPTLSPVSPISTPQPTQAAAVTPDPTNSPSKAPTENPTLSPVSPISTPQPTQAAAVTPEPTAVATPPPTQGAEITPEPTVTATQPPSPRPTLEPTAATTQPPTPQPTFEPTASPTTVAPTQPPVPSPSEGIVALRLFHAPTNTALVDLVDGMVVNLADFGVSPQLNVQAVNVGNTVNSVRFVETGRNEGVEPFAFCGDSGGNYYVCGELGLGSNTVSVIPYPGGGQSGTPLPTMSVNFEVVNVLPGGHWIELDANANIQKRHENCFAMVGRKAYLMGGRFTQRVDIYDPVTRTWSQGAQLPLELHHMQCVAAQGKLWIVAAWTGGYPRESNAEHVYVYDPLLDSWSTRTAMPLARRRGGGAAVVSDDETKIYVSHGNSGGHETGNHAISHGYLDEYTIATDSWRALPDAPNPRDHCGGALVNGRICVGGGRNGGVLGWPEVAPTDCFNLATEQWSVEADIPQVRGGSSYGTTCDGKLMVAGGEGSGQAWAQVDVFDGSAWTTINSLVVGRHGTQLAVDCVCDQIYIASGAETVGGQDEITSLETYFPGGTDVACTL